MMKKIFAMLLASLMVLSLFSACGETNETESVENSDETETVLSGIEDGVLTVAMECAYAPYNWAQTDDSNGAVKI